MGRAHQSGRLAISGSTSPAEAMRDFRSFARGMDAFYEPNELLRALPGALTRLFAAHSAAVICLKDGVLSCFTADEGGAAIGDVEENAPWHEEIRRFNGENLELLLLPDLERETELTDTVRFFRELGNQSLCLLPLRTALHRLGALCIAKEQADAFPEDEIGFLSVVADYVAL